MSQTNTPVSTHASQALLRINPEAALEKNGFIVTNSVYQDTTMGGPCKLVCTPVGGGVYKLDAQLGSGDYFFPYVHVTSGGVGVCIVPEAQPNGVIVCTGGMNGCALQVNRYGSDLYFYHDANSNSMVGKLTPGDVVCRVGYDQYAGFDNLGQTLALEYKESHKKSTLLTMKSDLYHEYYLLTVRVNGMWKVYVSSLLRATSFKTAFWSGKNYTDVKLKAFQPKKVRLVGLF